MAHSLVLILDELQEPPTVCCGEVLARARITGVSAGDLSAHVDLDPTPAAARAARAFVAEHVGPLNPDTAYAAAICASELVTNGVLHARTPIVLGVTLGAQRLLVTVTDHSTDHPQSPPRDNERPSGRGIVLVDALADEWGVCDGFDGKTVWFTVSRADA